MFSQICETLNGQIEDEIAFSTSLSDFMILISSEKHNFNQVASDPQLPEFLSLCIFPFNELKNNIQPDYCVFLNNVLVFLDKLFSFHPSFLNYVAKSFHFDHALSILAQLNDDSFYRTYCEFIAHLSIGKDLQIQHPKDCLDNLIKLYQRNINSGEILFTITGLIRNSPAIKSAFKSSSYYSTFQSIVTQNVSTDDHFCVISSLAALISYYPGSIDDKTGKLAAIHALSVSNNSFILLHSALWIFEELVLSSVIESKDIEPIINLAVESPPLKSFYLFEGINYLIANSRFPLLSPQHEDSLSQNLTAIVALLFSQENGYLTRSIVRLIQQLYDTDNSILDSLNHIPELIFNILKVISSSSLIKSDPDYIDSILIFLRFLSSTPKSLEQIIQVLPSYEEQLFVAFQRTIETNNGFAALNLYIFILQCSQSIKQWERRLQLIIADSQFGALLAHVLENSTDRRIISDAIQVISQISTVKNFSMKSQPQSSILFDSLISGFVMVNLKMKNSAKDLYERNSMIISQQNNSLKNLREQYNLSKNEARSLKEELLATQKSNQDLDEHVQSLQLEKENQQSLIESLKTDQTNKTQEINQLNSTINSLNQSIDKLNMKIEVQNHDLQSFEEQLQKYAQIDKEKEEFNKEKIKMEYTKENTRKQVLELESTIRSLTATNDNYKEKNKELKTINDAQKSQLDDFNVEKEKTTLLLKQNQEIILQKDKIIETNMKKYNELKNKIRELKQAYDAIRLHEVALNSENESLKQKQKENENELARLHKEKKDWELLLQFMHRITDDDHPPSEQLMGLMDDI